MGDQNEASCACLIVTYYTTPGPSGTVFSAWKCSQCGAPFERIAVQLDDDPAAFARDYERGRRDGLAVGGIYIQPLGMSLYRIQDDDRPMWVVAESSNDAIDRWRRVLKHENPGYDMSGDEPNGIEMVCCSTELLGDHSTFGDPDFEVKP